LEASLNTLECACAAWAAVLGQENVTTQAGELRAAETATFPTGHRIPAILRPGNREEISECLRVAARFQIPLYPISSGRNWGYGSRAPAASGCALLDLRRMNRILEIDEELAYVTVEPGVTQQQLYDCLRDRGSRLWMDATGASPHCSLIGNTMERGFGHTPYGDHASQVCGLEVILPTGECLCTGFGRFSGTASAPVYRWGVGPSLDGLFTQSNLGIVTRMSLWLMPAPDCFQAFLFRCDQDEAVAPVVDALRRLRLAGVLRSAVHIGNSYKILAGVQQYPWNETAGRTPLDRTVMRQLASRMHFGSWNGSGGLYGTTAQVAAARRAIRDALRGRVDKLQFLDDRTLEMAARFSSPVRWVTGWDLSRSLELVRSVYGLLKGIPTVAPLRGTYWRKRMPPPADPDPDRDGCGLLWCSPMVPATGVHAMAVTRIASETLLSNGFEPSISLTLLTERALCCVISIGYDRDVEGEDDRALACYRALTAELEHANYPPYRHGVLGGYMRGDAAHGNLLRLIKDRLDPDRVLAPGRYEE